MKRLYWGVLGLVALGVALAGRVSIAAEGELKVGDKAPAFSLEGLDGKTYSLEQFKGKKGVVLAWFPKADTPGCTKECKSIRDSRDTLKGLNIAYFTASVDKPADNKKFSDKYELAFPILSDPDKSVAKAYGVLHPARPFAQRWTFYIDKEGVIKAIDKEVQKRTETAGGDIAAKVKELGLAGE